LGVGRTTLREALRLLETRGVLTIRAGPKGGPVVRRPSAEDFGDALALILQFEGASLSDVIEARNALEPMLARLAAPRIDADQAVIDRLTAGDAEGSAEAMRRHLTEAAHYWRSRYPELYDSPVRWVG